MPPYAIMRSAKLKGGKGNVASSLKHSFRERETPNADPTRTPDNERWEARSVDETMGRLRERLDGCKVRKDSVLVVEYFMGASPEFWRGTSDTDRQEFFLASKRWIDQKYGRENVIAFNIHMDETSPHASAHVVPRTPDGRLSAKQYIGNRQKMTRDQDSFWAAVKHLGLERGVRGSRARHQRVKTHYAALDQAKKRVEALSVTADEIEPRRVGLMREESPSAVADRVSQRLRRELGPDLEAAAEVSHLRRRLQESRRTAAEYQRRFHALGRILDELPRQLRDRVLERVYRLVGKVRDMYRTRQRRRRHERDRDRGPGL